MDMDIDMDIDSAEPMPPASAATTTAIISTMTGASISPSEDDLSKELRLIRTEHPTIGAGKFVPLLKERRPEWSVSEKRVKKLLQQHELMVGASGVTPVDLNEVNNQATNGQSGQNDENSAAVKPVKKKAKRKAKEELNGLGKDEEGRLGKWNERGYRYPVSYPSNVTLSDAIDLKKWNPRVEIRNIDDVKGKGLFATNRIEEREVIWKEEPWILAADWNIYINAPGGVCSHCCRPLDSLTNTQSVVTCSNCLSPTNKFCNRLCYTRAQATYHPFLCEGINPACIPLMKLAKDTAWGSPHALVKATAKILALYRDRDSAKSKARPGAVLEDWNKEWEFFKSLTSWTLEDKYRCQGKDVPPGDHELWTRAHKHYVEMFLEPPTPESKRKLQHLMKKEKLPQSLINALFTFEAFCTNLCRINLNRESHGGLYKLHSHINHTCKPNTSARHLEYVSAPARLSIVATRVIEPGEEITVTYVDPELGVTERRRELRQWGIEDCDCGRCVAQALMEQASKQAQTQNGMDVDSGRPDMVDLEKEIRQGLGLGL